MGDVAAAPFRLNLLVFPENLVGMSFAQHQIACELKCDLKKGAKTMKIQLGFVGVLICSLVLGACVTRRNKVPVTELRATGADFLNLESAPMRAINKSVNIFIRYHVDTVTNVGDSVESLVVIRGFCVARNDQNLKAKAKAVIIKNCSYRPNGGTAPPTSSVMELRARPVNLPADHPFHGESSYCYIPADFLPALRLSKKLTGGGIEECRYGMAIAFQEEGLGGHYAPEEWLVDPVRSQMADPENHNFQLGFHE